MAEAVPTFPIPGVRLRNGQVAAQDAFQPVGRRRKVSHELVQVGVGHAGVQVEITLARNRAVEIHVGGEFPPVKVGLQVGDGDGFLWDMPLFGIFSSALNAVMPGLGNSRVSGGSATFTLINSVIHTDDMEIRSPAMRLVYRGAIDFQGRVDARVEARLLRDAWVIGPLVSLVLSPLTKLFEYKVTGTLHEPQKEPLYIPKPLTFPLHPFRSLRELFSEEKPNTPPPTEKPPPR